MDAGKAIQRNLREVWIPEYDSYVFKTLADAAINNGAYDNTPATKSNAYELFLKGMERLGNCNVPDQGRVAFCSYGFANLLKQDSSFMRYGDQSQQMLIKGVIGEVDGCKIVKVPSSRLPAGAACIITHPVAATAPKQLEEYKIHDNPPGISGWLCEGRFIYDCFILNEKIDAVYFIGGQTTLKHMNVITAAGGGTTKAQVVFEPGQLDSNGAKWYAMSATSASGLTAVTPGTAITTSGWTELSGSGAVYTAGAATHKYIRVIEVDSANKPIAMGDSVLNLG